MMVSVLTPPPTARAPVADVANWFTPPPWHHKPGPPSHGPDEGDHMAGNPDYEFGHGAYLTNLRRRIGISNDDTRPMADMLRVRHGTYQRWESEKENIHKDVVARARDIDRAQMAAISKLIDEITGDRHEVTVHRGDPAAERWNQIVMLARVLDPRIAPVLGTGSDGWLFNQRRQLALSVNAMADLLGVRKTTFQRWEAGTDPIHPDVVARVDNLVAAQDALIARITEEAHTNGHAVIYRDTDEYPFDDIDGDDWNYAVMLATVKDPTIEVVYPVKTVSRRDMRG